MSYPYMFMGGAFLQELKLYGFKSIQYVHSRSPYHFLHQFFLQYNLHRNCAMIFGYHGNFPKQLVTKRIVNMVKIIIYLERFATSEITNSFSRKSISNWIKNICKNAIQILFRTFIACLNIYVTFTESSVQSKTYQRIVILRIPPFWTSPYSFKFQVLTYIKSKVKSKTAEFLR